MLKNDAPIAVLEEFAVSGPYPPGRRAMDCTLEVASNGDLLAAYMESADHHLTDNGVVTLSRSTDGGVTWPGEKNHRGRTWPPLLHQPWDDETLGRHSPPRNHTRQDDVGVRGQG